MIILHKEILIPKYNEYPFEKGQKWADRGYDQALLKVDKWKVEYLKKDFQIRAADYVEKMTFIFWRLIGPVLGRTAKEAPLEILLDCLKPHIIKGHWGTFKGSFRLEFTRHLKDAFEAIHNSNYLPGMVKDRNDWINTVLANFADGVNIHLEFVLHLETLESYDSPKFLEIRNLIWKHFVEEMPDYTKTVPATAPIPGRPCQMEMHLDLIVKESR